MARANDPKVTTVSGRPPEVEEGPTPTERTLPDGQKADHWVLREDERAKGRVRPLRLSYKHVGIAGPKYPLRDTTPEEMERHCLGADYTKYEEYPESESPLTGKFWPQDELDKIGCGCGTVTTMPRACAETYSVRPSYYGSTFCCGCGQYLPVGADGEFVWLDDGTRVGT